MLVCLALQKRCGIRKQTFLFLQVLYKTTHWLRTWATLQQPTSQEALVVASRFLEQVAKDIFSQAHGWRSSHRIDNHWRLVLCRTHFRFRLYAFEAEAGIVFKTLYLLDVTS